jgi:serine/threonine-protein kinase
LTTTGQIVGNYRLLAKLGEGGMGKVFRGIDLTLERTVAIKVLHSELARRADVVERFRKEAIILARLHHPNISTLFSFFREGNSWFMVMEFASGETLDRHIARHPHGMPWQRAVSLTLQCLQALEHAHSQGVIHRDLKPANVMVAAHSAVKVMDFGIAWLVGGSHLTRTGHLVGSPAYMSPEQVRGQEPDPRSDLYALGIVLYEMLAGQPPFRASSDYELLKAHVERSPPPLRRRLPELPVALEQSLMRALAKKPEERFQTALDFRLALEALLCPAGSSRPPRISSLGSIARPQRPPATAGPILGNRLATKLQGSGQGVNEAKKVPSFRLGVPGGISWRHGVFALIPFVVVGVFAVLWSNYGSDGNSPGRSDGAAFQQPSEWTLPRPSSRPNSLPTRDVRSVEIDAGSPAVFIVNGRNVGTMRTYTHEGQPGEQFHLKIRRQGYRDIERNYTVEKIDNTFYPQWERKANGE